MAEYAGWRPIRETHAIENAAVSVMFGQGIGDVLFRKVEDMVSAEAKNLGLDERAAGSAPVPRIPGVDLSGFEFPEIQFARRSDGEVVERLVLTRDTLQYEQAQYTRWAPFLDRARRLMSQAVDRFCEVSTLSTITGIYNDVFLAEAGTTPDVTPIVSPDSPFVAKSAFRSHTPWHTHSGYFEWPDEFSRRLINVNVQVADLVQGTKPPRRGIRIFTQVSDQLNHSEVKPVPDADANWNSVEQRMQNIHLRLKSELALTLTPEAAHRDLVEVVMETTFLPADLMTPSIVWQHQRTVQPDGAIAAQIYDAVTSYARGQTMPHETTLFLPAWVDEAPCSGTWMNSVKLFHLLPSWVDQAAYTSTWMSSLKLSHHDSTVDNGLISGALKTISRLRQFSDWPDNWDAEGAPRPDSKALDSAVTLVGFLESYGLTSSALLDSLGQPMLLISNNQGEGEITVTAADRIDFVWFGAEEDSDVDVIFDGTRLPDRIATLFENVALAA